MKKEKKIDILIDTAYRFGVPNETLKKAVRKYKKKLNVLERKEKLQKLNKYF